MSTEEHHALATRLVEAGNRLHAAHTEKEKHTAAVELMKLRLQYFTGELNPFRDAKIPELCAQLTAEQVTDITDWCWSSYSGGMVHMKKAFEGRQS
jgi:hypothetical protein